MNAQRAAAVVRLRRAVFSGPHPRTPSAGARSASLLAALVALASLAFRPVSAAPLVPRCAAGPPRAAAFACDPSPVSPAWSPRSLAIPLGGRPGRSSPPLDPG